MAGMSFKPLAYGLVAVVLLAAFPLLAQAYSPTAAEAMAAALAEFNRDKGANFQLDQTVQSGGLAYAYAGDGEELIALLAEEQPGRGWKAIAPAVKSAMEYNRLLERFPDTLLDEYSRAYLRIDDPGALSGLSVGIMNYSGHKLPYRAGDVGLVTQIDLSHNNTSHINQVDFVIYDSKYTTRSRDVVATKPGTVIFVKDNSNITCLSSVNGIPCWKYSNMVVVRHSSTEFTWYVHLAYQSAAVKVGQFVTYGAKLGVQGNTGYSTGTHLHYMASSDANLGSADPIDHAKTPWPTYRVKVDFLESTWANLKVSSWYTSKNINSPFPCPAAGGVLLYRDSGYSCAEQTEGNGYAVRTVSGPENVPPGMNDAASSVFVPSGWSVMLYEHSNRGGAKRCVNAPGLSSFAGQTYTGSGVGLNDTVSSFEVFSVPGCPVTATFDTTAPGGAFSSPAAGATAGQFVQLSATASDSGSGVGEVRYLARWEGQPWRRIYTGGGATTSYNWDLCAGGVPDGEIELALEIRDQAGNLFQPPARKFIKAFDCAAPERASQPPPLETCETGQWCAEVWPNTDFSGDPASRRNAGETLSYAWGSGGPHPALPVDHFATRFTRTAPFTCGTYQFTARGDDAVRVWVNDVEQTLTGDIFSLDLPTGAHALRVEQIETEGDASVHLSWVETARCPVTASLQPVLTEYRLRSGSVLYPALSTQLSTGFLEPARGDALVQVDGNGLGAGATQAVRRITHPGESYPFDLTNHSTFRMTVPASGGPYDSNWQIRINNALVGDKARVRVIVDNTLPQVSLGLSATTTNSSNVKVTATITDASPISHVRFYAGYIPHGSGNWQWVALNNPVTQSGSQWSIDWDTSPARDQSGIQFFAYAWDQAGNFNGALSPSLLLDRTLPTASFQALASPLDTTRFLVRWTSADELSGIKSVAVQVRKDSGSWITWQTHSTGGAREAWYTGELGSSYTFQVRAEDQAGNVRTYSTQNQVTTLVSTCTPDAFEPNGTDENARLVVIGGAPINNNFCGAGDEDRFKFTAEAGKTYLIYTTNRGLTSEPQMALYKGGAQVVNFTGASIIRYTATGNDTMYVRVRHANSQVAGNGVTYSFGVAEAKHLYLPVIMR